MTTVVPREETSTPRAPPEPAVPSTRVLVRIVLIVLAWTTALGSLVGAFVAPVLPGGWFTVGAAILFAAAPSIIFVRGLHDDAYPSAETRVFILRPFWYSQITLLVLAPAAVLGALVGWPFGAFGDGGRTGVAIGVALVATLLVAGFWGSRRLVVKPMTFTFSDLPAAFDGMRIAQISDLHVGPHTPRAHLEGISRAVRAARPDLIAITGDQVDDFDKDVHHFNRAFADLRAPLGVAVIPGNHDVYAGWDDVERGMRAAGFTVLVNDAIPLTRRGDTMWLAGTGDPAASHASWGGGAPHAAPDIARTLAKIPKGAFTLALAHNPALWSALAARGVHMTLSGHTHHGQLSIPALDWCLASPFLEHAMGAYTRGASQLYINPGTNYWGVPLRIGAWPEVTVITLRRG